MQNPYSFVLKPGTPPAPQMPMQQRRGPSPMMLQRFMPGAQAPAGAPAGGANPFMALMTNPAFWIPAAVIAGATALDQSGISNIRDQLRGKAINDILESPKVNKVLDNFGVLGEGAKVPLESLGQFAEGDIVNGLKESVTAPWNFLKSLFGK